MSRASGRGCRRLASGLQTGQGQRQGQGMSGAGGPASGSSGTGIPVPGPSSSDLGVRDPAPSAGIPASEPQPPFFSPGPWSLQPLLPSALGREEEGGRSPHSSPLILHKSQSSGPQTLSPPNPGVPTSTSLAPAGVPALWGLRGRGHWFAMVPDCLGLLSGPAGAPRVCGEGGGPRPRRSPAPTLSPGSDLRARESRFRRGPVW